MSKEKKDKKKQELLIVNADEIREKGYLNFKENFFKKHIKFGDMQNKKQKVKFIYGTKERNFSIRRFYINLIFLRIHFINDNDICFKILEEDFFDENINEKSIYNRLNYLKEKFFEIEIEVLKSEICNILEDLIHLSSQTNKFEGKSLNLYSLVQLAIRNPEFYELTHFKLDENNSVEANEVIMKDGLKRLLNIMKTEDSCVQSMIAATGGLKEKQVRECFMNVGYKPSLFGDIIETPVNSNYLRGVKNEFQYAINAEATRKAMILNYKYVKKSGYLTRKLELLTLDLKFSKKKDCQTEHYLDVIVENKETLRAIVDKYYLTKTGKLKIVKETNEKLIGKTIQVRSPIFCKELTKGKICAKCFGNLYSIVKEFKPGLVATLFLTSQFTQNLLSSKHLIRVNKKKIIWSEELLKYFDIKKEIFELKEEYNGYFTLNNSDLIFDDYNHLYYFTNFTLHLNENGKKKKISFELPTKLYTNLGMNDINLNINKIKFEDCRFSIISENIEFSKKLEEIEKLLESNNDYMKAGIKEFYNQVMSKIANSGIFLNSTHLEAIMSRMVRNKKDLGIAPDWSEKDVNYQILRISDAILKDNAASLSLSYERIASQIKNLSLFNKTGKSDIEVFYE